jgi:hypothetical protein
VISVSHRRFPATCRSLLRRPEHTSLSAFSNDAVNRPVQSEFPCHVFEQSENPQFFFDAMIS